MERTLHRDFYFSEKIFLREQNRIFYREWFCGGRAEEGHVHEREQLQVARLATVALGIVAVLLGIAFKGQNVAFTVSLAFAIAASANFPALVLAIF